MGKVIASFTTSLDGFIAYPDGGHRRRIHRRHADLQLHPRVGEVAGGHIGNGVRYLDGIDREGVRLDHLETVPGNRVIHLRYQATYT